MLLSAAVVLGSLAVVFAGLWALGFPLAVAASLAAISVATDPAAVSEAIDESGQTNLNSRVMLGIVAIDDAWG
ncbi:hypothetical protein [Vreelandella azerica]|uniref:hypothetical protein n=1 Tax=Vreelandella azerica TaxID=2732867 RepID=UPI002E2E58D1|nr:hypothetical protein [Halomonas azerica]